MCFHVQTNSGRELPPLKMEVEPFGRDLCQAPHFGVQTPFFVRFRTGGVPCRSTNSTNRIPFEVMSKRRRGFPSETQVKRGVRIVHGDKLLEEKLGRNDLCPCGSSKRLKNCCLTTGCF